MKRIYRIFVSGVETLVKAQSKKTIREHYKVKDVVLTGRFCHTNAAGNYSADDYEIADDVMKKLGIEFLKPEIELSYQIDQFQSYTPAVNKLESSFEEIFT